MSIDLPALDQYDDPYPIRDLDDWFRQPEVPWLIEDIIPSQGTGFIYGPTGQYKSFVAIAIAGLVNTKQPLVEKAVTSQGRSLFCLMEGYQGFGYRVLGWQQYYDDTPLLAKFWDYPVDLSNDSKVDKPTPISKQSSASGTWSGYLKPSAALYSPSTIQAKM